MSSQINPGVIDAEYPIARTNNNSQTFRDTFANIKSNLYIAQEEITELQNREIPPFVSVGQGLTLTEDPNDSNNIIIATVAAGTSINSLEDGYSDLTSVGLGAYALGNVDGDNTHNTAVGISSLSTLTTGTYNTAIGEFSGSTLTTGTNVTTVGYNAQPSLPAASNEITLGNVNVERLRIPGLNFDTNSANDGQAVTWDATNGVLKWADHLATTGSTVVNIKETVINNTDGNLNANVGSLFVLTLAGATTMNISNLASGQSMTVHVIGGDVHTLTWPADIKWSGGTAPVSTAYDVVEIWKIGTITFGAYVGDFYL